jgi:hypothetical protein
MRKARTLFRAFLFKAMPNFHLAWLGSILAHSRFAHNFLVWNSKNYRKKNH